MDPCTLTATGMKDLLDRREITSLALTEAHFDRIDARDGALRVFTALFREQALASARRADERRARGERLSPIDGLPVSIKESLDVEGLASTLGVPSRRDHRAVADAAIVRQLRAAGAVVLGRTNVSQYLLYHESRNPIFGQTANPWDLGRTPGGSSGGEGASLAAGFSALGIGTDIGGSIRVPAHFCGVVGLKPTLDRWSNRGSNTALMGQEAVRGQVGPMARTVADVTLLMHAIDPLRGAELDGRVPPLPFGDPGSVDLRHVRVGVYETDGLVPSSAAVGRAVRRAADALREAGCEVVPFLPPRIPEHVYLYFAALSADGGAIVRRGVAGDEMDPVLQALRRIADLPAAVRTTLSRVLLVVGEERVARLLEVIGEKSVDEFWAITNKLRAWRFEVTDALDRANIQVLLCPPHATPALPHLGARDFLLAGSSSMVWNVLQFPAGVVPVTRVRKEEARRSTARDRLEKLAARVDEASTGLPVGVQVVARPWREDVCLAAMGAIEAAVARDEGHPKTPV
ncbi:MAG: amidase [Deltaproteobacteria bacterium]|nr:amidase [Deltaproteobacteria bacterium]